MLMKTFRSGLLYFLIAYICVVVELKVWGSDLHVPESRDAERVILFLGNSLTAGYGLDISQAFPSLIQKKIKALGWNFKVVNAGLSGETSAAGLRRIDWLLGQRIDVLVLELGVNDGLRGVPVKATFQNLQSLIDKVKDRYPRIRIVIAGMLLPPNLGQDYSEGFRLIFSELAKRNQASLIPFLLQGVGGKPELNLSDGIHPTPEGHRIVAESVWKVLRSVLKELKD